MNGPSRDALIQLYIIEHKTMKQVADELGIAVGTVYNYMKKYGIESREAHKGMKGRTHTKEVRDHLSATLKGRKRSDESIKRMSEASKKGGIGHKKKRSDGYMSIYFPDHPKCTSDGYIMEHVLVMESIIGRWLREDEVVHHVNRKRDDNRKENLKLMTKSEHMSFHMKERYKNRRAV